DDRADRSVPEHPEEDRLAVLEAGAQQRGGGEAPAQRGRRGGGGGVANPRVVDRVGRDHGDGADGPVRGGRAEHAIPHRLHVERTPSTLSPIPRRSRCPTPRFDRLSAATGGASGWRGRGPTPEEAPRGWRP